MDTQNWRRIRTGAYEHTTLDAEIIKDRDSWRLFVNGASVTCYNTRRQAEEAMMRLGLKPSQRPA